MTMSRNSASDAGSQPLEVYSASPSIVQSAAGLDITLWRLRW